MRALPDLGGVDAWRQPAATIGEMPCERVLIDSSLPVYEVERIFLTDPTLSSLVVNCSDGIVTCLSRDWFFGQLAGPLGHGRSLYARHLVSSLPRPTTFVLSASITPLEAASEVQGRPVDSRYHDILVAHDDGQFGTIVVADLFAEVAHTHAYVGLHDPLTGLANRRLFLERLRVAHERASVQTGLFGVLFVDLDDFKPINDVLGHETGDVALTLVAERLRRFESSSLTVARFGGDEFGVLVESTTGADAILELAEQITTTLTAPMLLAGQRVKLGASIGVALADGESSPETLLRNADMAMYTAKRDSDSGYAVYEAAMHARASSRLQLRSQLEVALERGQFELFFQPLVEISTLRITGAEALLRWRHPDGSLIPPVQFIPLCEQNGLIVPIGSWVLQDACERTVEWHRRHPEHADMLISVNISPRQLLRDEFITEVAAVLEATGLAPELLTLEITENVFIEDFALISARLEAIRDLGVRIALDDFGSGFSSLGYLSQLPIDLLKVDRRFVMQLGEPGERGLLNGIVALTHSLEIEAIAEGVETERQLAVLRASGCEGAQGYLFAAPMPASDFEALLASKAASTSLAHAA